MNSEPNGTAIKAVDNLTFCGFPGDPGFEIIGHESPYTVAMRRRLYQAVARGGTFVEIGAHIGCETIRAAPYFQRVMAFEPSIRNYTCLVRNFIANGITNVKTFQMAISDFAADNYALHLFPDSNAVGHSLTESIVGPGSPSESVPVGTLNGMMMGINDCTMLHIDAEGHDVRILQGGESFIKAQQNPPVIVIEFSPQMLMRAGSNAEDLHRWMFDMQYGAYMDAGNNWARVSAGMLDECYRVWCNSCCAWLDLFLLPIGQRFGGMFPVSERQ